MDIYSVVRFFRKTSFTKMRNFFWKVVKSLYWKLPEGQALPALLKKAFGSG